MNWEPTYTLALIPIGSAVVVSMVIAVFGGSLDAAQWGAIITFFITLPFVVSRLMDRAK
jgi:uncharacterized protein (DUF2062 family)